MGGDWAGGEGYVFGSDGNVHYKCVPCALAGLYFRFLHFKRYEPEHLRKTDVFAHRS